MRYLTLEYINILTHGFLLLIPVMLSMRAIKDFLNAYLEEELGLKMAFQKVKKRVFAAVIAITVTSIVELVKGFY